LPTSQTDSVIGSVLATGQPIYVANVQTDARYLGKELARQEGLVSLLSVPLSVRDRVIGVFNCYSTEPRQFNEEQQTLFVTLANQTALAIENARLVTNTAVVREMHHRIKNNLQTVAMLMQLQLGDADRLDTREVLQTNIHRIRSIAAVHEILSEKGFRLVDVKDVLERISQATAETMSHPDQVLTIRVFGDPLTLPSKPATAIALVVNELVQNSLEHAFADRSADGQIDISLGRSPEEIIIIVRDNGSGLPDTIQTGLGLEIVETLVQEDLNGRLKFNRPPQGGTEISLRLPRSIEQEVG
jgi:two-component sensor histidine kinase